MKNIDLFNMSDEEVNRELANALASATDGEMPKVAAASEDVILRAIQEAATVRKILPHVKIENSDLTYSRETDRPVIVEEMEPQSPGSVVLSFNDHPDTESYRRDKFIVIFDTISTPEFVKNVDELRVGKSDVRQMVSDNCLRSIEYQEDVRWYQYTNRILGGAVGQIGYSGAVQWHGSVGPIDRETYVDSLSHLIKARVPTGVFVTNMLTANEFLKFKREDIGGDLAEAMFKKGREALEGGVVMNVPHIFTLKNEIVGNNLVYQYGQPRYLGRAYILQDVRMYVEKKVDHLRFHARLKKGITVANVAAVQAHQFGHTTDTSPFFVYPN